MSTTQKGGLSPIGIPRRLHLCESTGITSVQLSTQCQEIFDNEGLDLVIVDSIE
ncbi:MAG: hypothetical protein HQK83_05815 [Fibrobacteria bacterium]|nr:hypothetical protein [Fibrobacteria bacterium]